LAWFGVGLVLAAVVTLTSGCPDRRAPGAITGFLAVAGDALVTLTWTNPTDGDFDHAEIVRKVGAAPASASDGTTVYTGSDTAVVDVGLANGTQYFYSAWALDKSGNRSAVAVAGGVTPTDSTPPGPITGFGAVAGDAQVVLTWTNPLDGDFDHVEIVRKAGVAPTSVSDGAMVYAGSQTTTSDLEVANGTEYFYSAWAFDANDNPSAVAIAGGVTPTSASASGEVLELVEGLIEDLELVLPDLIELEPLEAMQGALEDADFRYRTGDACGAGLSVMDFLGIAQEVREGEAIPVVEELYNRGRMVRFEMLSGFALKADCPSAARIGQAADAAAAEESLAKLKAVAQFGEPKVVTVKANDEVFTEVLLPGADTRVGVPGEPAVPMISRLFAVPIGAEPSFDVTYDLAETVHMNLVPVQNEPVDEIEDSFANWPFVKNEDRYDTDALYPADIVTVQSLGAARDLQMFMVTIAAGQYNPVTDELRLFKNLDVRVDFKGGQEGFITERTAHEFDPATRAMSLAALNRATISKYIIPGLEWADNGEELMILTTEALRPAADALADWKNEKGILTRVFEVMDVDGPGPDSANGIDALIKNRYDECCVRPSYVLLLGDAELIPTFYPAAQHFDSNGYPGAGTYTIGSDWQYAVYGDPATDKVPDFAVGRIPVDTLDQANTVVDKIIAYEKTPPDDAAFYSNAAIAAQFQCCRYDITSKGYDQRTFIEVSEFARNAMVAAGKSVDRIYTKTVDALYSGDNTPRRYYDGGSLPASIGPGYSWAGDTDDIADAYNAGRFLFIHRDHGAPAGWGHPSFYTWHADDLTNGSLLPVVYSVNCSSGLWDNETAPGAIGTSMGGVYLAEALLRDPDGGAVGILGDTRNSPSWTNSALLRGFMDATWPSAVGDFGNATVKRRLGDILNHGKLYMWTQIGVFGTDNARAEDELRMWHVIGDPTLEMWTRSPHLVVLPGILNVGVLETAFHVAYPQDGATITAFEIQPRKGPVAIARGVVEKGEAVLPFVNPPYGKYPIEYHASFEDAVSKKLVESEL